MTWKQLLLFADKDPALQGPTKSVGVSAACYLCKGTGLLQSDEECACVDGQCGCKECK